MTSHRYAATANNVDLDHAATVAEEMVACNAAVFPLQYAVFVGTIFLGKNSVLYSMYYSKEVYCLKPIVVK